MPYSRALLLIHPMYNSFYLPTPSSQSIPLSLASHKSVLYVCEFVSVLGQSFGG